MNPVYEDVAFYLNANFTFNDGAPLILGDNLFGGEWEASKDAQVLLLEGVPVPSPMKDVYEELTLQALVRGKKQQPDREVYSQAYQLMRFLLSLPDNASLNGCIYKGFEQESGLLPLGKDENQRFLYSFNLSTYRSV